MVFCSSKFRKGILHHCRLWIWHLFNKKYFSRTSATHIPISCVPNEETASSKVSAICVGNKVAYMEDMGRKVIFRVDTTTGSCTSFGADILGNTFLLTFSVWIQWHSCSESPLDIIIWGDYVFVLDLDNIFIFTPMGILVKKCRINIPGQPITLKTLGKVLLITR